MSSRWFNLSSAWSLALFHNSNRDLFSSHRILQDCWAETYSSTSGAEFVSASASASTSTSCLKKPFPACQIQIGQFPWQLLQLRLRHVLHSKLRFVLLHHHGRRRMRIIRTTSIAPNDYPASWCLLTLLPTPRTNHDDHYNTPPMSYATNQSSPDIYGNSGAGPIGREHKDASKFGRMLRSPRYWHVSLLMFYCRVYNMCGE